MFWKFQKVSKNPDEFQNFLKIKKKHLVCILEQKIFKKQFFPKKRLLFPLFSPTTVTIIILYWHVLYPLYYLPLLVPVHPYMQVLVCQVFAYKGDPPSPKRLSISQSVLAKEAQAISIFTQYVLRFWWEWEYYNVWQLAKLALFWIDASWLWVVWELIYL